MWLFKLPTTVVPDHFCFFLERRILPFHLTLVPKPAQKQETQYCRQYKDSDVTIIHLAQVKTILPKKCMCHINC